MLHSTPQLRGVKPNNKEDKKMPKNTESPPFEKEITFYKLINCTPSFLEFDKNSALLKNIEKAESSGEQFLVIEDA